MIRIINTAFLLILFAASVFLSAPAAATEITINGTGYANPLNTHPTTTVDVYDKSDLTLLGTTTTDENGDYSVSLTFVGTGTIPDKINEDARLIQNPSGKDVNVELSSGQSQNWQITGFDEGGRVLCSQSLHLAAGTHNITIDGLGVAGLKTIVLKGISKQYTLKAILTLSVPLSPHIESKSSPRPLKATTVGDSLLVVFTPPDGFIGTDTTVYMQSQQVNYVLQQIPYVVDLTAVALMHLDTATANIAINIQWSDSITTTHYGDNGYIHIYREYYSELSDTAYVSNADTTIYSNLMWARLRQHPLNMANLFQSEEIRLEAALPALALISILPDTFNLFFQVKQVVDHLNPGQFIRTDGLLFLGFFLGTSPGRTIRYTYAPEVIDSIDNFRMMRFETFTGYGELVSQELFDKLCQQQDSAFALFRLPYGIDLLPPIRTENVDNPSTNQRYLAAQSRGFDQAMKTLYSNTLGTPGVYGISLTNLYTIIVNGESTARIKGGFSKFLENATTPVIKAEQIGNLMNGDDVGGGGSSSYLTGANGENTDFAKVAAYTVYMCDPLSYPFPSH